MKLFRAATVLLIFSLFTIGSMPATGLAFSGYKHWAVHFVTYALLALFFGLGWQRLKLSYIALIVAAIGFVHELSEIVTHSHALEFNDVVVNASGALTGAAILIVIRKFWQSPQGHF